MKTLDNINLATLEQTLKAQSYIKVPFPVEATQINAAIAAFFRFLEEPLHIKEHIDFGVNPKSRRGEVGYRHREHSADLYNDSKEFFHYHASILDKYSEFIRLNPVVQDFVTKAQPIWLSAKNVVFEILQKLDTKYPDLCKRFMGVNQPEILLRFLKYNWQNAGKFLAKPHYDAGSCTLAIAESDKGLRIGRDDATLSLIEHNQGEALFMVSKNFAKLTDETFLPAWHDVIQINKNYLNKPFARWALVCFFEAEGMVADPRTETHTQMKVSV